MTVDEKAAKMEEAIEVEMQELRNFRSGEMGHFALRSYVTMASKESKARLYDLVVG